MATLPPNIDLSTLTSSAELFSQTTAALSSSSSSPPPPPYTLPQIRAVHAALHARVADVSARLRTRVGESYRDLLGTADAIVAMRADLDRALLTLGDMGGRCGRGVVGAKAARLRGFVLRDGPAGGGEGGGGGGKEEGGPGEEEEEEEGLGAVARARLLEGCLLGLRGLLRRRGPAAAGVGAGAEGDADGHGEAGRGKRLVLAARLYVLGRLLVKSFGGRKSGGVEAARRSLGTVHRERLTRCVDAVLRSASERAMRQGDVLRALSAYSLAEGAGAREVLGHFLRVRSEAIAMALEVDDDGGAAGEEKQGRPGRPGPKDVLTALGLYTKTLQDVQALAPAKLADALVALKKDRLLEDPSLREMEILRLDVYRRWCGDEIQFYTPFIRHDDLDVTQAREMLTSWADRASDVLLRGLEKALEGMAEFKAIVELRTSTLKLWIAEGGKARGPDPSVMLNKLREVINKHMLRVLEAKVTKLRLVGSEVSAALDAWREEGTTDRHRSLWDVASLDTDLTHGAARFTQDVVARLYGRNDAVSKAVASYKTWFRVVGDVGQVVDQLERQRWDNDVDEIEDEEVIEERQQLLSRDDPQALGEHLNRLLVEAFRRLDEQLATLWNAQREGPNRGAVAMYFLRLLRDIRAGLPDVEAARGFGLAVVPSLHETLAATVAVSPLDEFATVALARKTVAGRSLWEGEPPLPGSPSAGVFRFLRNLMTAMGGAGGDLWSPSAVAALKRHLGKQVHDAWLRALDAVEEEVADGNKAEEEGAANEGDSGQAETSLAQRRDLFVQWLWDIHYLRLFLAPEPDSQSELFRDLEDRMHPKTGLESAPLRARMAKASQEYFKKTALLFSLLT